MSAVQISDLNRLWELITETRDDMRKVRDCLGEMKQDYARRTDLQSCRAHCDKTTGNIYGRILPIEAHVLHSEGREKKETELRAQQDLEAQQKMKTNIMAGAVITAVAAIFAAIGSFVLAKIWP